MHKCEICGKQIENKDLFFNCGGAPGANLKKPLTEKIVLALKICTFHKKCHYGALEDYAHKCQSNPLMSVFTMFTPGGPKATAAGGTSTGFSLFISLLCLLVGALFVFSSVIIFLKILDTSVSLQQILALPIALPIGVLSLAQAVVRFKVFILNLGIGRSV